MSELLKAIELLEKWNGNSPPKHSCLRDCLTDAKHTIEEELEDDKGQRK